MLSPNLQKPKIPFARSRLAENFLSFGQTACFPKKLWATLEGPGTQSVRGATIIFKGILMQFVVDNSLRTVAITQSIIYRWENGDGKKINKQ